MAGCRVVWGHPALRKAWHPRCLGKVASARGPRRRSLGTLTEVLLEDGPLGMGMCRGGYLLLGSRAITMRSWCGIAFHRDSTVARRRTTAEVQRAEAAETAEASPCPRSCVPNQRVQRATHHCTPISYSRQVPIVIWALLRRLHREDALQSICGAITKCQDRRHHLRGGLQTHTR